MDLQSAIDILSRTVYGEARNQSDTGMAAVAWVVRNRAEHPRWWGHDIASVCMCPWQFSCWNETDPNRAIVQNVEEKSPVYRAVVKISQAVLDGRFLDPTNGADSYFAAASDPPDWVASAVFTVQIGAHRFYRVELSGVDNGSAAIKYASTDVADALNEAESQNYL